MKFFVDKDKNKNSLSFKLTNISGKIPKLKEKRVGNFSLTKIGQKRKRQMAEPIETVIIQAQQNFNSKIYGLLEIINLKKINNWKKLRVNLYMDQCYIRGTKRNKY